MAKIPTITEVSAGGVAYRRQDGVLYVALISVGDEGRWQLPKGRVDSGESTAAAAVREVREEAGVDGDPVSLIDKIQYWFYSKSGNDRKRIHKYVYFYLLEYRTGDVSDHDWEVNEARWVAISDAQTMLAFDSEKKVVEKAAEMIAKRSHDE